MNYLVEPESIMVEGPKIAPAALASEQQLVNRILSGEKELYGELVELNKIMIFNLVLRQVGDQALAEELAQDVFVKAYLALKRFRFDCPFSAWLVRIALNSTSTYFSSKRFRQHRRTESFETDRHDQSAPGPQELLLQSERLKTFQRALGKLRPKLRAVLVLCSLEQRSYEEAAEILQIPVGTVRSRLHKGRAQLAQVLRGAL